MRTAIFVLLSFIGIVSSANSGSAALLNRSQCEPDGKSYDYSGHFGAVRDQDGHGLCWAFTGAGLLEEELCLTDAKYCGKHLSVLDASRVNWTLSTEEEGGKATEVAMAFLSSQSTEGAGVCLEDDAPFANVKGFACTISDFLFRTGPSCLHKHLGMLYSRWQEQQNESCSKPDERVRGLDDFASQLKSLLPVQEQLGVDFKKVLNTPEVNERVAFLKTVLITPKCEQNRMQFKRRENPVVEYNFGYKEYKEAKDPQDFNLKKFRHFLEGIKTGRSVALSICALQAENNDPRGNCGSHAILATGLRWNVAQQRCEMQMRNSWGKGANLHGWVDAETIINYTNQLRYLQ